MHKAKGAWNMLKAVCEFNEILSVLHWVVHSRQYDIVICRAQSFISFKEILYQNTWGPYIAIGRPISTT